jgi:hypothetical protein
MVHRVLKHRNKGAVMTPRNILRYWFLVVGLVLLVAALVNWDIKIQPAHAASQFANNCL